MKTLEPNELLKQKELLQEKLVKRIEELGTNHAAEIADTWPSIITAVRHGRNLKLEQLVHLAEKLNIK